jgi:hypothetical protein
VRGIADLDPVLVEGAPRLGLRVKLVGLLHLGNGRRPVAGVLPLAVPAGGHLGSVRGANNVIVLSGEETGELVQLGQGSGKLPVATALLNDLIGLFHPSHSWVGRFPPAPVAPVPPEFARFLVRAPEVAATVGVAVADHPSPDSVPLLESLKRR